MTCKSAQHIVLHLILFHGWYLSPKCMFMKPKKLLQPKNSPITQGYSKQQMSSLTSRHSAFIEKWYFWLVSYPFSTLIPDPKRNTIAVSSTKFSPKNRIFSFQSSIINQPWKINGWNPTKNHPFYTGKSSSKPP